MHIAPVCDAPPLEQVTITRQYDAAFGAANALDFVVDIVVVVQGVESAHAQQSSKPTQMGIGNETRHAQRPFTHAQQWHDIERFKLGIHGDAITVAQQTIEADGLAIDQQQFDLGMRHAE